MDSLILTVAASVIGSLLGVIAYFLDRLIKQFDRLSEQFGELNNTMTRIDGDVKGEVGLINNKHTSLERKVEDMDQLWDRVRTVETELIEIKNGGCKFAPH